MSDRVTVWVQRFKGLKDLRIQWIDPNTGKRRTESAETDNMKRAQKRASDKEYELNNGLHKEPSKMTWKAFREIYQRDKLAGDSDANRSKAATSFDRFEA